MLASLAFYTTFDPGNFRAQYFALTNFEILNTKFPCMEQDGAKGFNQREIPLMPYPCSRFCADIKVDSKFDIRFGIKLGDGFHVNHTKCMIYGIA